MLDKARRERSRTRQRRGGPVAVPDGLHPMIATKLWDNPCRLSFRANFIAHHFNQPIYDWIWRTYRLSAPEHVVLYALGLRDGITADDVAASSARPKATLSRAIKALVARRLITRVQDSADRRRLFLFLSRQGRRIVEQTVPLLISHEQSMLAALTAIEQRQLDQLLTKLVLGQSEWPTIIEQESAP